jgi:ABC-type branched-subunit amino acid transport system substrate-binding protein
MSFKINSLFIFLLFSTPLFADVIQLGMSAPFTGPAKEIGTDIRFGAQLYLNVYNKSPQGKRQPIEIISYDDGYEPNRTIINTRKLIEEHNVFALFSYVGTPTSKAIMPLVHRYNKLYLTPFTGAEFLRNPVTPGIFNIRSSYYVEAEKQVDYFIDVKGFKKPALFIQADAFGISASQGFINALHKRGIDNVEQVRYQRNTVNISNAIEKFKQIMPDVIFCIGTYEPLSEVLNTLRADGFKGAIVFLSFAGAESLLSRLKNFDDVYITSAMSNPSANNLPIAKQYLTALGSRKANHQSFEGYINAAFVVEVINRIILPITPEKFIEAAESKPFDLGGLRFSYGPNNHQGLYDVSLYQLTHSGLVTVTK